MADFFHYFLATLPCIGQDIRDCILEDAKLTRVLNLCRHHGLTRSDRVDFIAHDVAQLILGSRRDVFEELYRIEEWLAEIGHLLRSDMRL